ncbi:MAG TPA: transglycosylase domain-containing protein, partial [Nitrosospira sp.]|nr:transglycosylase domain-containing protein [Nitrosospira sp.]
MRRALKLFAFAVLILLLVALSIAAFLLYREAESSAYQARHLTRLLQDVHWEMKPGRSDLRLAQAGPYDIRLGYSRLPELLQSLTKHGFEVQAQARVSPQMKELVEQGLFIPYPEKSQAGLEITAGGGEPLYRATFPGRVYDRFESVPSVVADSLLFIENRDLLDLAHPKKNPAIDWTRLGKAVLDKSIQFFSAEHDVPGGSTLATQIEKYRHSPNGLTMSTEDKLQQMVSASLRAYLYGENTMPVRKQIVVDYLNTVPLAAAPGFGETNGLGDALWAWYGLDFDETNHILNSRFVQGDAL